MELERSVAARSMIPVVVELGCTLGLVWDGDGDVVVPGLKGIEQRWDGIGEFDRREGVALLALF
jgi:hypothetical protein